MKKKISKNTRNDGYEANPFGKNVKLGKHVYLEGLPSPAELAAAEKTRKITLAISEESLEYFKAAAQKYKVPYQTMIRRLLDEYRLQN